MVGAKSSVGQTTFSGITLGGVGILKTFTVMFLIKFYLATKVLGFIEPLEYLPFYHSQGIGKSVFKCSLFTERFCSLL